MASDSNFLSQTLRSITTTKKHEQNKRRTAFENRKSQILHAADSATDDGARLDVLLSGITQLTAGKKGVLYVDEDRGKFIKNAVRYLEQYRHDPTVSSTVLRGLEASLRQKLEQDSQRFNFAELYYRLLSEWIEPESDPIVALDRSADDLDGSFEHVQKYTLQNLKDNFTNVVFAPFETDKDEIEAYMDSLFEDDHAAQLLAQVRESVKKFAASFKANMQPFNRNVLQMCIEALLTNNLLNDDAKNNLSEFLTNEVVLNEIADVLNLRFSDLDNWSWEADEGMYYEPRRQANGKYRIMMDQDIIQAIFLHYIAVTWSGELWNRFSNLVYDTEFWGGLKQMPADDRARYTYFTGRHSILHGIANKKREIFISKFFLSALPRTLLEGSDPYGDDDDSEDEMTGMGLRQYLLRQIASDTIISRDLTIDKVVVQSDLQWYATSLPHSTLWAVLRFWGVPESWIKFFTKFVEAPLRMTPTPGEDVRIRQRGIPITDASEKLFGECVLFCMDVAVERKSGAAFIRFHDDLWLHDEPKTCAKAWRVIEGFVQTFGLAINTTKTGSVYIAKDKKDAAVVAALPKGPVSMGLLQLNENGMWTIDQDQVASHVQQLRKQLGQCTSIISWIQTWNACMGRFFQNTLGKPANCLGQEHVDDIIATHSQMQRDLFELHNGSVTEYLQEQISKRFGVADIPGSFFFLPEDFGGLGLQNPFIPFFMLRDQVLKDPQDRLAKYHKDKQRDYEDLAKTYAVCSESGRKSCYKAAFESYPEGAYASIITEPFFTFEEFTKHCEINCRLLSRTYDDLMQKPQVQDIELTNETKPWFEELKHSHEMGWKDLTSEYKWIMDLYADDLKARFGALSIVDRNLLPSGVMKMLKQRKLVWQQIFWE